MRILDMRLAKLIVIVVIFAVSVSSRAEARWLEALSANFIVYSDGREAELRRSVALLEDYDRLLRTLTGTTAPPSSSPLKVYLVGSNDRLRQVSNVSSGARGFYSARVGGTAAFAVRGDQPGLSGDEVLLHEYAHHFMRRYHPAYHPTWYSEGVAEYLMTAQFGPERIEVGRFNTSRAATLLRGTWLPLDRMLSSGTEGLNSSQAAQFYAQSWLLTHYIFATAERREALRLYLADLHGGVAEPAAFLAAFGVDHTALEADLKRYMNGPIGYLVIDRTAPSSIDVSVRNLPEAADDLILPHAALMLGIADSSLETTTIAAIREAAARYPDDPYAQRVLARAEINSGDRAAGVAMIDRLLEQAPRDAELLYLRGVADFYSGRKDEARRSAYFAAARPWFVRAIQADPHYYTAVYRLAQCAPPELHNSSDETLAHLMAARELAPLVGDIAIDAATALLGRKRFVEAEAALVSIVANPHGRNDRARALLMQIQAARRQASAAQSSVR